MSQFNCSIGKKWKKGERFELRKFGKGFNILNPIWWSKALSDFFKVLIICGIIFGLIFGYGYWKGMKRKPLIFGGYKDFIAYTEINGEERKVEMRDGHLYIDEKVLRVSDVPQLKPYGIKIRPKLFAGVSSIGEGEVGLGAELAHYFRWNLDVFGTKKAVYAGVSYDIELADWMRNSSAGIAFGKAWENPDDSRFLFYWALKF